jgi:hypothetical protein
MHAVSTKSPYGYKSQFVPLVLSAFKLYHPPKRSFFTTAKMITHLIAPALNKGAGSLSSLTLITTTNDCTRQVMATCPERL